MRLSLVLRRLLVIGALSGWIVAPVEAQSTWRRTYGGHGADAGMAVRTLPDDGAIVVGSTGSFGNGASDVYALRLDPNGQPLWSRTYGSSAVENGVAVVPLNDGFLFLGTTFQGANGSYDLLAIRTDLDGSPLWERNYGSSGWDLGAAATTWQDGFVLVGTTFGEGYEQGAAMAVFVDHDGEPVHTYIHASPLPSEANVVALLTDGSLVMAGNTTTANGDLDGLLVRLAANGAVIWQRTHGGAADDNIHGLVLMPNDELVAVGGSRSHGAVEEIDLLRFAVADGATVWEQHFGNSADAAATAVVRSHGEGVVITGYNSLNQGERDMIITGVDDRGYWAFGNNFGEGNVAEGSGIDTTSTGYIVVGRVRGYGPGYEAVYVVRTDLTGATASTSVDVYTDPVGISVVRSVPTVVAYPNPLRAGERLHFKAPAEGRLQGVVYSAVGSVIATVELVSVNEGLLLPPLAPGSYLLRSVDRDGRAFQARFLVQP